MLANIAVHQSAGFCSTHIGRGVDIGYSVVASAATPPSWRINSALHPVVPTSMPRR